MTRSAPLAAPKSRPLASASGVVGSSGTSSASATVAAKTPAPAGPMSSTAWRKEERASSRAGGKGPPASAREPTAANAAEVASAAGAARLLLLPLPSPRGLRERGSAQRGTRSRPPRAWRSRSEPGKRRQHAKEMKPFERSRSRSTLPKSPRRSPPRRRRQPRLFFAAVGDTEFAWLSAPPARLSEQFGSRRRPARRSAAALRGSRRGSFGAERRAPRAAAAAARRGQEGGGARMNSLNCRRGSSKPARGHCCFCAPHFQALAFIFFRLESRFLLNSTKLRCGREKIEACEKRRGESELS